MCITFLYYPARFREEADPAGHTQVGRILLNIKGTGSVQNEQAGSLTFVRGRMIEESYESKLSIVSCLWCFHGVVRNSTPLLQIVE